MSQAIYRAAILSPLGVLYCSADDGAVLEVLYAAGEPYAGKLNPVLARLRDELDEYFAGQRKTFGVPLALSGTAHRLKVWDALRGIPYGETVSYRHIAERVGSAPIAVGQAVGANRVNILIPCHRVVGSDGSLTGYGGGLERKKFLLDLEGWKR
ncbi:MAG: methylated-DNA--[protein]-cysteine S-methyltransferase [Oscillospiraceae bacterium]|nr:methylated-DNA--[protein]-cysteine S-methyltransferase [Oscillospiraceae bacterium]